MSLSVASEVMEIEARYLSTVDAAKRLGITARMLVQMRNLDTGPRFAKFGHRTVRYRVTDLDAWAKARVSSATP